MIERTHSKICLLQVLHGFRRQLGGVKKLSTSREPNQNSRLELVYQRILECDASNTDSRHTHCQFYLHILKDEVSLATLQHWWAATTQTSGYINNIHSRAIQFYGQALRVFDLKTQKNQDRLILTDTKVDSYLTSLELV